MLPESPSPTANPALVPVVTPLGPAEAQGRLATALAFVSAELPEAARFALASAVVQPVLVTALVQSYRVLAAVEGLPPVWTARLVEVSELLATYGWHELGTEAAGTALAGRARLATP